MIGYIFAGIIALAVLGFLFVAMAGGKQVGTKTKENESGGPKPVGVTEPAADAPNPDRSARATPQEAETARRHTPPA